MYDRVTHHVNTESVMGEVAQRIMKLLFVPLQEIANSLGVGYDTVKGWSSGRADPSPENGKALAKFMRQHAKKLLAAADELEGSS